jgi:hypothetical protein
MDDGALRFLRSFWSFRGRQAAGSGFYRGSNRDHDQQKEEKEKSKEGS